MPDLPSHTALVEAYKAEVTGDPDTSLTDFSPGSVNRGFAGIAVTAAQGVYRWITRTAASVFVQSAENADLDAAVEDRVGEDLPRLAGESDEAYRARYFAYIQALGRGTAQAWAYFIAHIVEGADPLYSTVTEDPLTGRVRLSLLSLDGYTTAEVLANAEAALDGWRIWGVPVDLEVT